MNVFMTLSPNILPFPQKKQKIFFVCFNLIVFS